MLKAFFHFQPLRVSALALGLAAATAAPSLAQGGTPAGANVPQSVPPPPAAAAQELPSAPSSLLPAQIDRSALPPGSGLKFQAASISRGPGGVAIEAPTAGPLRLSLDDAIALGLERNLSLKYQRANQRVVRGDELGVINALLPTLRASAQASAQELDLAAMGFRPNLLAPIAAQFGLSAGSIPTIVKVNTLQAAISASQDLFDLPAFELYLGAKREATVVDLNVANSRGDLVLAVGSAYLRVLADQSAVANAESQERASRTVFEQASARRDAGVGINLDVLRGQVDYQQRQQGTISARTTLAKDLIQLNRIMGLPANQPVELTDSAPFNSLADLDLDHARTIAYAHRKDLQGLEAEIGVDDRELRAVRYQRLPTLAFNGFYGVIGATGVGPYHGVFNASGSLRFPIFREAEQRGQEEAVNAQLTALRDRETSLRATVDQQIRSSMLDIAADRELVQVAQSSVGLAEQELSDARDRFAAGVEDNLPVVDAEATVAGAQTQLVRALFQYNLAKLQFARNLGIVESRYRLFLGPMTAPPPIAPTPIPPATSPLAPAPAPPSTPPSPQTPQTGPGL